MTRGFSQSAAIEPGGLLGEMTWTEVKRAAGMDVPVILGVGATEQHGPHLPLGTDCLIPVGVALEVSSRIPVVVAPPIPYGARSRPLSGGGEGFPGTVSLRATTLIATIQEVLQGLMRSGFKRLCVQNWHYENAGLLWEACDLAAEGRDDVRILLVEDPMPAFTEKELGDLFPTGFEGWDVEHASVMETSLMYVLYPRLVRQDRVADDRAQRHPRWDVVPPPAEFIPTSGVLSRPTGASAELGERFLERIADHLQEAIETELIEPASRAEG